MEQGHWDEANEVKKLLEEAQRKRRRELEAAAKDALAAGREPETYKATWFRKVGEVPEAEQNIYYKMSVRGMKNYKMVSLKLKPNESGSNEGESHTTTATNTGPVKLRKRGPTESPFSTSRV